MPFFYIQCWNSIADAKFSIISSKCGRWLVRAIRVDIKQYYKIGMCCFSVEHVALSCKSKRWLACNQDSVSSKWRDMLACWLLFYCKFKYIDMLHTCSCISINILYMYIHINIHVIINCFGTVTVRYTITL